MRRKDREITHFNEIYDTLNHFDTIRIAINGGEYPYIVPVSFGMEIIEDKIAVYFHCAKAGMKVDLINKNPKVCIEGDSLIHISETEHGITSYYKSVMGFGECHFLSDKEEIKHALYLLMAHYEYPDYSIDNCSDLNNVLVGRIILDEIYGKKNASDMG